jgi:hypothetical protein
VLYIILFWDRFLLAFLAFLMALLGVRLHIFLGVSVDRFGMDSNLLANYLSLFFLGQNRRFRLR